MPRAGLGEKNPSVLVSLEWMRVERKTGITDDRCEVVLHVENEEVVRGCQEPLGHCPIGFVRLFLEFPAVMEVNLAAYFKIEIRCDELTVHQNYVVRGVLDGFTDNFVDERRLDVFVEQKES